MGNGGIWAIVILLIAAVFTVMKVVNKKQAVAVKIVLGVFFFLVLTFGYTIVAYEVDVTSFEGVVSGFKIYSVWLGNVFGNVGKVSNYAVQQEWGLNSTISK